MNYIKSPKRSSRKKVAVQSFLPGMNASLDESILPPSTAKAVSNFDFSSGALREGYGMDEFPAVCRKTVALWTYRRYDLASSADEEILMYQGEDGAVYYQKDGIEYPLNGIAFTSPVLAVSYRLYGDDVILMCSSSDEMAVWDGKLDAYTVAGSPFITSMAMHYERMFCTVAGEKNAVWFSSDLDPTNWDPSLDKGGFIQVIDERGKLNCLLSFLNYVYIFRDYGISRLTAFADQSEFAMVNLFTSSGKIYPRSVTLCGDTVLFLATDGVYRFDGFSTRKILSFLSPLILPSEGAVGAFHDGKYFLSCQLSVVSGQLSDEESDDGSINNTPQTENCQLKTENCNNAVLVYDIKSGAYSMLTDVAVTAFAPIGGRLIAVTDDGTPAEFSRCGHVFGTPTVKAWESGWMDFGTERVKRVSEIFIESDGPFQLSMYSEKAKKDFDVTPQKGITRIRVNLSGRKIGFSITAGTTKARITRPTIIFTT